MTGSIVTDSKNSNLVASTPSINNLLPSLIKLNPSDKYHTIRSSYLNSILNYNQKLALFMALILSNLTTVVASNCFKSKAGNSYTLNCISDQSDYIYSQLVKDCGAYTDGHNDCAGFFDKTLQFCSGLFGGAACELSFQDSISPDSCIVNKTASLCHNGYGTTQDVTSTIGIGVLIFLCCCMCIYCRLKCGRSQRNGLGESVSLLIH